MRISDWSSDVCSSDLLVEGHGMGVTVLEAGTPGWGASGRNGGFCCLGGAKLGYDVIAERYGTDEMRSEEHTSELQSLMRISYAVFCLKKKKHHQEHHELQYTYVT